ncbi:MAG: GDSL-type esterase/lipase family protein [Candidatus Omnitrophica bacterium]|nr:GDSL-type esterase/lipase family protein [Candidatus Omnitrophota bacterium]
MLRNKKLIFVAVFMGLLALVLISCARRQIKNIDSKGTSIICFGDSITFGHGVNPGEDYPSDLAKMTDLQIINAGIDSDTSADGLQRIDSDVLEKNPRLVIVEFGGNDFIKGLPMEETAANIRAMVDRIQAKGAMVAIFDISSGMIMGNYRSVLRDIALEKQAIFIPDALKGILTNPELKSDFIHPNAAGYKIVAHRVYRAIRPYLNENTLLRQSGK